MINVALARISDATWDNLGVLFGVVACTAIARQVVHEWRMPGPSSVSLWFVIGFLFVYLFWFLYGVRFRRRGIWLPNVVAVTLQIIFASIIVAKA
jgi:uncharacterized protein with PQ loop repeat